MEKALQMIQTVRENLDEIERFIHSGKNDSSQHRARKRKASSTISNSAGRGNSSARGVGMHVAIAKDDHGLLGERGSVRKATRAHGRLRAGRR